MRDGTLCGMPGVRVLRNVLTCSEVRAVQNTQRYHGDGQAPIKDPMVRGAVAVVVLVVPQQAVVPVGAMKYLTNCPPV